MLGALGEDCDALLTPNVGNLYNQAVSLCVKMSGDQFNRKPMGVC